MRVRGGLPLGLAGLLALAGCNVNEVEMPRSPCRKILDAAPRRESVDFVRAETGQISVFRKFRITGDSLGYTRDTLVARVGAQYPESFALMEQECPENHLNPYLMGPGTYIVQRLGGNLRASGSQLVPYVGNQGMELDPDGPLLDFRGLAPPEGLVPPLYGRIAGFHLAGRVHDTVAVRVENSDRLRYWIYSAATGPLVAASVLWDGTIEGWARID